MTKKKIETPRYRSTNKYKPLPTDVEKPTGESITVPGESLTMKEILERFVTGIGFPEETEQGEDENFDTDTRLREPGADLTNVENIVTEQMTLEQGIKNAQKAKLEKEKNAENKTDSELETQEETTDPKKGSNEVDDEKGKSKTSGESKS